jgi:hypothetical protein
MRAHECAVRDRATRASEATLVVGWSVEELERYSDLPLERFIVLTLQL